MNNKELKISSTKEKKKIEFPFNDLNLGNLTCDYKNKKIINFNEINYQNKNKSSFGDS